MKFCITQSLSSVDIFRFVEFEQDGAAVKAINILNAKFFHGFALRVEACRESSINVSGSSE